MENKPILAQTSFASTDTLNTKKTDDDSSSVNNDACSKPCIFTRIFNRVKKRHVLALHAFFGFFCLFVSS